VLATTPGVVFYLSKTLVRNKTAKELPLGSFI